MRQLTTLLIATLLIASGCSDDSSPAGDGAAPTCSPACGPNATCQPDLTCSCAPGWLDCNGDKAQSGGDGCECSTTCNGAVCDSAPTSCTPQTLNACGSSAMYCNEDTCERCPAGTYNCDGTQDCESAAICATGECELFGAETCGSQSQYCDATSKICKPCAAGTYNCSMNGGDCECTTGCDGASCKKECTFETGCGDTSKYCDMGTCTPCAAGKANCDNKGECECTGTCSGGTCQGTAACDYYDLNACGGDTGKWCYQNQCISCTSGYFNCNNTEGCECDSAGCNGTACAGKCLGGEC
jgi:hypothetical protein